MNIFTVTSKLRPHTVTHTVAFPLNLSSFLCSIRTRLYFTSESHIHSLVNLLRFGRVDAIDGMPMHEWNRQMEARAQRKEGWTSEPGSPKLRPPAGVDRGG